ncbi:hypothetical protein DFH05DRAFT_1520143 [Lentinula detonsa]|uniref:Uncharacterized protein n=1 Tax=Lentinula detonsa TaxID=2804962 RepID=A0A9W8P7I2_9AGAR|nr:hypothetical protein DFH05DRAFT_1520143 [Lentinula detonsa]
MSENGDNDKDIDLDNQPGGSTAYANDKVLALYSQSVAPLTEELKTEIEALFHHNITHSTKWILEALSTDKGYKIGQTKLFSYLVKMRADKRNGTSR